MFCQNCGTQNSDDALFCENCGTRLEIGEPKNTYPPTPMPVPMPMSAPAPVQKPFPKLMLVLAVQIAAAALLLYGIYAAGQKTFGAEKEAEDFFVSMANGDWDTVYDKLDLKESDFICSDLFEKANRGNSIGIVSNYEVRQKKDLEEMLEGNSSLAKEVTIDFQSEGNTQEYRVPLVKHAGKKYLLFDNWKIDAEKLICKDFYVYAPAGAKVSVDGIKLNKEYAVTASEESASPDASLDTYRIPELFKGLHDIKITMEGMDSVTDQIYATSDEEQFYLESMNIKDKTLKQLIKKAAQNMKAIYDAALSEKNFASLKNLFTTNAESLAEIEESYRYLVSDMNGDDSDPYKIAFSNISGTASPSDGTVCLTFDYTLSYTYTDWWSGESKMEAYNGSEELTFLFTKEDGEWVQGNLGCEPLYY